MIRTVVPPSTGPARAAPSPIASQRSRSRLAIAVDARRQPKHPGSLSSYSNSANVFPSPYAKSPGAPLHAPSSPFLKKICAVPRPVANAARGATHVVALGASRASRASSTVVASTTTTPPSPNANAHCMPRRANRAPVIATTAPPLAWPRRGVASRATGARRARASSRVVANRARVGVALARVSADVARVASDSAISAAARARRRIVRHSSTRAVGRRILQSVADRDSRRRGADARRRLPRAPHAGRRSRRTIVDDRRRVKRLDRGVRILAVARRGTKGEPLVLLCHPLRTQRRDGDDGAATRAVEEVDVLGDARGAVAERAVAVRSRAVQAGRAVGAPRRRRGRAAKGRRRRRDGARVRRAAAKVRDRFRRSTSSSDVGGRTSRETRRVASSRARFLARRAAY